MCGLVGVAGRLMPTQDKVFKQLLYVDGLRGMHSTGTLFVPKVKKRLATVLRSAKGPTGLLDWKDFNSELGHLNKVLLGHNRYATVGEVNAKNAHPFLFDTLAGAHNGTLRNKQALPDSEDFEVDSQNLFHSIEKIGLEDTYDILIGAWALSWFDLKKHRLNFLRNNERPLSYCFSQDRSTLYWASEAGMLKFVLDRCKVYYTDIVNTKPHHLYSFKINGNMKPIEDIKITDMTPKRPAYNPYKVVDIRKKSGNSSLPNRYANKYNKQMVDFVLGKKTKNIYNQDVYEGQMLRAPYEDTLTYVPPGKADPLSKYVAGTILTGKCTHYNPIQEEYYISPLGLEEVVEQTELDLDGEYEGDTITGFNGEPFTFDEFHARISGCAWCADPMFFESPMTWVNPSEVLCDHCNSLDETKEFLTNS